MRVAKTVLFLLLVAAPRVFAQPDIVATIGEPVGTFPRWEERVLQQLTNRARVAPATDLVGCGANCSAAELAPTCYTPIAPLAWNLDLNEAARFHSAHMARSNYFNHNSLCRLFPDIDARYPESCDASYACSCEADSPVTTPSGRIGLFGTTYSGEIIAAGQITPYQVFYAWLHEAAPSAICGFGAENGHRWLILKNAGPAVGYGYHFEASATYDHYWTGDFGGSGTVVPKIPSGSHWGATTRLKQEANIEFWVNWYDVAGPTEPSVIVDGVSNPLVLSRGTLTSGAWTATLSGLRSRVGMSHLLLFVPRLGLADPDLSDDRIVWHWRQLVRGLDLHSDFVHSSRNAYGSDGHGHQHHQRIGLLELLGQRGAVSIGAIVEQ